MRNEHPVTSFDPNRPDFAPYGLTCVHWRPAPMRRPDHHNEIELNFLETGSVTYLLGGNKTVLGAGRLSIFWAAIPHQIIDCGRSTAYYVVTIPLPWFLQWRLPEHFTQALLQGRVMSDPSEERAKSDRQQFASWEEDLRCANPELEKAVLLEMHARLVRMGSSVPCLPVRQPRRERNGLITGSGLNRVERMASIVAQRYTERLTVQEIADIVKLHPNYAMNLFQKSFGTTLISYLTQHRVSHAQRLLATSDQTIADVAFNSGFNSISRFNDAFRRACGCSPRDYRQTHLLENLVEKKSARLR